MQGVHACGNGNGNGNDQEADMTLTPQPIKPNTGRMAYRSPIGTRYTISSDPDGAALTLVAYHYDHANPEVAIPYLVDDSDLNEKDPNWFETLTNGSVTLGVPAEFLGDDDILIPTSSDPEMAARARIAAMKRYNEPAVDTMDLDRILIFDDVEDNELPAVHEWCRTERALREAQAQLALASRERGYAIEAIVNLKGSQEKAGGMLGLAQSSVSRAMRSTRELP